MRAKDSVEEAEPEVDNRDVQMGVTVF